MPREFLPALRGLLAGGPRPEHKDLAERVRASASGFVVPGQPYVSTWNTQRATEEAYEGNPLVYRAIEVICQHAIAQRMVLRRGDPDEGPLIDQSAQDPTRLLYVLNRRANPWETSLIFRHRLIAQFLLSSRGVFVEVIRTKSDRIGMLNLLDPDLCDNIAVEEREPGTNEIIHSDPIGVVQVRVPGGGYNYLPRFDPNADAQTQPSSVLWIRSPHPLVMWKGMSPVQAAGLSIDLDRYARIYNRRFLQNDGRPGGLISIKGTVDHGVLERIQAQFNGGPDSAGRTTVVSADQVSFADTSGSPRDMMWGELSKATSGDIEKTFGVPESVMGNASGRTFDNADAEYELFWVGRMLSLIRTLDDQMDILTGGYDDDLYLRHDLSKVWVLGRHKRTMEDRALADLKEGVISFDEYREIKDLEPFNVPGTSVLWTPVNKIPIGRDDETTTAAAALKPVGISRGMSSRGAAPGAPGVAPGAPGAAIGGPAEPASAAIGGEGNVAQLRLAASNKQLADRLEIEGKQGGARA